MRGDVAAGDVHALGQVRERKAVHHRDLQRGGVRSARQGGRVTRGTRQAAHTQSRTAQISTRRMAGRTAVLPAVPEWGEVARALTTCVTPSPESTTSPVSRPAQGGDCRLRWPQAEAQCSHSRAGGIKLEAPVRSRRGRTWQVAGAGGTALVAGMSAGHTLGVEREDGLDLNEGAGKTVLLKHGLDLQQSAVAGDTRSVVITRSQAAGDVLFMTASRRNFF